MDRARILSLTTIFPSVAQPHHGVFLLNRLASLVGHPGVELRVVAPVPYFPWRTRLFPGYRRYATVPATSTPHGIATSHPRYPVLPKFGMSLAPLLLLARLVPHLVALRRSGFDFDLIDAYYLYPDGVAAAMLGVLFRKPVILSALGSDVSLLPSFTIPRWQIRWAAEHAVRLTAVCSALRDEMARIGIDRQRIRVVPHGVDTDLFKPLRDRAGFRANQGWVDRIVLSVGHLIPRKGHHLAIEAVAEIPDARLIVIGEGPEMCRLQKLARTLGVADRVSFTGVMAQDQLAAFMGGADVLLNCSDREGIANVLLEAMACGTPVAATAVWGTPEVITVPEAGRLIAGRTADAIAEALTRLFTDPPDRAATRRHAERFSWDGTTRLHMAAVRDCLGAWRAT